MTTKSRGKKKNAGKHTRVELAQALGVGLTTVDKLIAFGLRARGRRGKAHLYALREARQLAERLSPAEAAADDVLISDYRAHAEDFHDRRQMLAETWIADDVWRPLWSRVVTVVGKLTARWPQEIAAQVGALEPEEGRLLPWADGPRVESPAPCAALLARLGLTEAEWRAQQPRCPAPLVRPKLTAFETLMQTDPSVLALACALSAPVPDALPEAPADVDAARRQLREARTGFRRSRVETRRGHRRRAELTEAIEQSVIRFRLAWWNLRRQLVPYAGDRGKALVEAERVRTEALAAFAAIAEERGGRSAAA